MRSRYTFICLVLAVAACDRVTSQSLRDAGTDSVAGLWEQVDAGSVNYNAVAGSAPDNVLIVGDQGTVLHWDGIALASEASGTLANLRGVAVVDQTLAYAVGDQGTVMVRQDGAWTTLPALTDAVLNAVWASSSRAVVVGEQGTVLHAADAVWKLVPNSRRENYYAVTDSDQGVEVVGTLGAVMPVNRDTGALGSTTSIQGYTKVLAGATRYANGAFLVGVDGGFFFYSSNKATRITGLPDRFLRAVSVVGDTAWLVGHEGLVATGSLHGTPALVPTPDDRWLLGVYAASGDDVWVVGRSGLIMRGPPGVRRLDGGMP
jgi:hypothetical protein